MVVNQPKHTLNPNIYTKIKIYTEIQTLMCMDENLAENKYIRNEKENSYTEYC